MGNNLTIFAIPRGFQGDVGQRQRNAVMSWLLSGYKVLLCGDDPGVIEFAAEVGAASLPCIGRNEWGTPLLSDLFQQVQVCLFGELVAYVNADIMLDDSLGQAVDLASQRFDSFLVIGRRYDTQLNEAFDFGDGWQARLNKLADPNRLHGEFGLDYFGFRSPLWLDIPPLAVGRMRWDNWLLNRAIELGTQTVDATPSVLAIHQDHGYEHIPAKHGSQEWNTYPEIARNISLAGTRAAGTNSARWILKGQEFIAR